MKLATWKAASVLAVIGVLLTAGMGTIMFSASADQGMTGRALAADLTNETLSNLTVRVGAVVEGQAIPIIGAAVEVWSVNITQNDTYMAIILQKVGEATTDENGNATFSLAAGDYLLIANYSGLSSVGRLSVNADQTAVLLLHSHGMEMPPHHEPQQRCRQNITA